MARPVATKGVTLLASIVISFVALFSLFCSNHTQFRLATNYLLRPERATTGQNDLKTVPIIINSQ